MRERRSVPGAHGRYRHRRQDGRVRLAIENADAIAAVAGLDVLLVGFNDLCAEMGLTGEVNNPKVADAFTKVVAACRKHGKHPGMGGICGHPSMQH